LSIALTVAGVNLVRRLAAPYEQWESRAAQRRVLVLLPVLLCCAGGTVLGVPIVWAIGVTADAGKGAPSRRPAVNVYLMALGYKDDARLLPVLDDDQGDELMKQWRALPRGDAPWRHPAVKAGVRVWRQYPGRQTPPRG
jgi:hypothetical protein